MRNTLYAIPSYKCNLSCPHCEISKRNVDFKWDPFFKALKEFDGDVVLFGGEPLLIDQFLLRQILATKKIISISTNLALPIELNLLNLIKDIPIATSWNPYRFNLENDYREMHWKINMARFSDVKVLVTLTEDLIAIKPKEFFKIAKEWPCKAIRFEHLIADSVTPEFLDRVDEWLAKICTEWDLPQENDIIKQLDNWYFDCDNVYTLEPDGNLFKGCPHKSPTVICNDCLGCERADICRPCCKQRYCTYPKKTAKFLVVKDKFDKAVDECTKPYGGSFLKYLEAKHDKITKWEAPKVTLDE